jgi:hypothetical protein
MSGSVSPTRRKSEGWKYMSLRTTSQKTPEMKAILNDLFSGALPWANLFDLLHWHIFRAHLEDAIILASEN